MINKTFFESWLSKDRDRYSGKTRSFLTVLDEVDVILRFLVKDFTPPCVFELPKYSLESLQKFFIRQENNNELSILNAIPNLHDPSFLRNRLYSTSIQALLDCLSQCEPSLRTEFENWLRTVYLTPKGGHPGSSSIDTYINCLDSINKPDKKGSPCSQHSEQLWYNIYEYLYGTNAKGVFSIDSTGYAVDSTDHNILMPSSYY